MAKILRILNRFNLGGPTYNAVLLSRFINPEHETLLIGGDREEDEESSLFIAEQYGIKPLIIPEMQRSIKPLLDRKAQKKIEQIIKEFKPDIVHTHASKAGALGRRAAVNCGIENIVHTFHGHVFHSYFNPLKTAIIKKIERNLALKTKAVIALSEEQKRELTDIYKIVDPKKVYVIPLGFDLTKYTVNQEEKRKSFRNEFNLTDDQIVVAIIGRLAPIKNHNMFIDVADCILKKTDKKVVFFIVGDGESRDEIQKKITTVNREFSYWPENKSYSEFIITSWRKDIDVVNAGSDIIVLTSLNEGTPVSLIEAQAAGKPIVSTNVGGISNVVKDGFTALLCDSRNSDKFCELLLNLIENQKYRTELSNKGKEFVMNAFDYKVLCSRMNALYDKLLTNR